MVGLTKVALGNQVFEIPHRRHEAIGKRRHVPHPGFIRGIGHRLRLRVIHRDRLFAKHMFARGNRRQRDRPVRDIRRCDDHRLDIIARDDLTRYLVDVTVMPVSRLAFSKVAALVSQSATTRVSAHNASPGR